MTAKQRIEGTLKLAPPLTVYKLSKDSLQMESLWTEVADMLAPHWDDLFDQSMTIGDFRELALEGWMHIWVAKDRKVRAVAVVERWGCPRKKYCRVLGLAGKSRDIHKWFDGLREIEEWARRNGCAAVEMQIRRNGLQRVLERHGYSPHSIVMRKDGI